MRPKMKNYRDLIVWQKSIQFVTEIYKSTRKFPKEEQYGLTSQINRAAISIPSNIAEGYGRRSTNDYIRFLQISMGSVYEIQTQLEISKNIEILSADEYLQIHENSREIERMLSSMINKIHNK